MKEEKTKRLGIKIDHNRIKIDYMSKDDWDFTQVDTKSWQNSKSAASVRS